MSIPMEEGEYNGDHLDRVEEVSCLATLCQKFLTRALRFMALPQHKKLPQPPEGSTF